MLTGKTSTEQGEHLDVVEELAHIGEAISNISAPGMEPPIVNVKVDSPKINVPKPSVVIARCKPVVYIFRIIRQHNGLIDSVIAEPMENINGQ